MHTQEICLKCPINGCNKLFCTPNQLKDHEIAIHLLEFEDIPWIECSETDCQFRTKSKRSFRQHMKYHKKRFVCQFCDKWFYRQMLSDIT